MRVKTVVSSMALPTSRGVLPSLLLAILICTGIFCVANDKDIEKNLRQTLMGKALSLRTPCSGNNLQFTSNGQLLGTSAAAPWPTAGILKVTKVSLKPNGLEIEGNRVLIALQSWEHPTLLPLVTGTVLKITMSLDSPVSDINQVEQSLGRVFRGGDIDQRIAAYWKPESLDSGSSTPSSKVPEIVGTMEGNRSVFRVKPGTVESPRPVYTPDPTYTQVARQKRLEGDVILMVVVNENGFPEILAVAKDLGEGLGLRALDAVSQWRFEPATRNGQPVAALLKVKVSFKLY